MALSGTLKDFGIADILQLIGQQQKTGVLHLKSKEGDVDVLFKDGNIAKAIATSRSKSDLIGAMLVRAQLISEAQLEFALDAQKRTLQRLGDVLVAQSIITAQKFKEMMQLQTSETLYRLFNWKSGSYSFEQKDVDIEPELTSMRAESVLMEGFRRVDEWPVVSERISSNAMTFERLKELPPPPLEKDDFDAALDDAFAEEKKSENKGEFQSIGENERRIYNLIQSGRTVETLINLSCLGEFETCKSLVNLVNLGYLKAHAARGKPLRSTADGSGSRVMGAVGRVLVSMVMVGLLLFIGTRVDLGAVRLGSGNATTYTDPAIKRFASRQQQARIEAALDIYRLEHRALPPALTQLVDEGLLRQDDLNYPWQDPYFYRLHDDGTYVLLPPLR